MGAKTVDGNEFEKVKEQARKEVARSTRQVVAQLVDYA